MSKRKIPVVAIALAVLASACGASGDGPETSGPQQGEGEITVVATTTVLGDVVANIVGDEAEVVVMMPVGVDPHDFRASSQQVSALATADLVVANGLGLEHGLTDVLESAGEDGVRIFEVAPLVDPISFGVTHDEDQPGPLECHVDESGGEEPEDEDDHGNCDPHVWMDPGRVAEAARLIGAELDAIAPGGDWSLRADNYAQTLLTADREIERILGAIPMDARLLVTNHDSLEYFAIRYGFEVVGTVIPGGSTLGDPSSAELAALVEVIVGSGVGAIFTDSSAPSSLAKAIADEVGASIRVVELYSGSLGEPESEAGTLIGMLTVNAERIAGALSS